MPLSAVPSHATESISDRKKSRELAEARQSGTVAPEVDVKTNTIINPHNPEFITKRPWYLGGADEGPSLEHQAAAVQEKTELSLTEADRLVREERRRQKQQQKQKQFQVGMWVEALKYNKKPYRMCQIVKMTKKGSSVEFDLKFEDGTTEQKVKYRHTSNRIRMTKSGTRTMDTSQFGTETYDSKRDKYHGYDPESHTRRMEKIYQQREEIRREKRKQQAAQEMGNSTVDGEKRGQKDSDSDFDDSDVGSDDSEDEFVQRDEDATTFTSRLARQGGVGGAQMKVTARNLRIREDTAKYLRNLDLGSAYYDPKSRSMRDNPNPEVAADEAQFAGDNFARVSGDAVGLADTQLFAWEAEEKGVSEIHPQANPSQAELLKKQFKSKSSDLRTQQKKAVLNKYGGAEYLDGGDGLASAIEEKKESVVAKAVERRVRFGVSVSAEEYTRDGRLVQGGTGVSNKRVALISKYDENVFINGHTTVWGSYFHKGAFQWGYADDHSLMKNSYCTGANGRLANDEANEMKHGTGMAGSAALAQAREMLKSIPRSERGSGASTVRPTSSRMYGEANQSASLDRKKVDEALHEMERKEKEATTDRKRKYNSVSTEVDVTEEEMEAYRMRKDLSSDPMAKLASSEELLEYRQS